MATKSCIQTHFSQAFRRSSDGRAEFGIDHKACEHIAAADQRSSSIGRSNWHRRRRRKYLPRNQAEAFGLHALLPITSACLRQ